MLSKYESIVSKAMDAYKLNASMADQYEHSLSKARNQFDHADEAHKVAQRVAEEVQARAYGCIAATVSRCLEAIFEEPYEFKINFVQKRGQIEVELWFVRDDNPIDPMTASGGGVVDVAAFALRLASILMLGKRGQRILILDEPFKFVSAEYRGRLCDLLEMLADELGVQILMVSHIEELKIGTVIEMDRHG